MLRSIVSCAAVALVAACAGVPRQTKVMAVANVDMSTDELRQRVYELGHRDEGLIEEAIARIFGGTRDLATRRGAMSWGLAAIPAVQEATLRPEPLVAVVDLWALALQTGTWAEGPGRARLGEGRIEVEQAAAQMARDCEALAERVLGAKRSGKIQELRVAIERWAADNPITSPTFARPSASVASSKAFAFDERSGPGSFVVTTDERLAILGQRVAMLNNNVMTRMRWTLELLVQDSLGKDNATSLVDEGLHGLVAQRKAFAADVAREREAASEHLTREREALNGELGARLAQLDASTRALVDRALVGAALVGASLILLAACAVWLLLRAQRKPPGRKHERPIVGARAAT